MSNISISKLMMLYTHITTLNLEPEIIAYINVCLYTHTDYYYRCETTTSNLVEWNDNCFGVLIYSLSQEFWWCTGATAGHGFVMSGASAGKTSAGDDEDGHGIESSACLIIHV